ncbi:MBG domain-containing protein [Azospirillum himalayense]|uniref:MBG domain-containing protein n=1 Tax=Azospirillum himalayense TaxID=654847 RepID=A0ABW0GF25_9PROT
MTTGRRRSTGRTIGRGSLLFLLLSGTALTPLHSAAADDALPTGGRFTAGSGRIAEQAGGLRIDQGSRTGIVEWQGFSIGAGKSVHIDNGAGATLNRVTGALPSRIDGSLTATGSAYLVNRAGIVVGKEGRVATGGSFIASTHDVPDAAFAARGDLTFAGTSKAAVVNMGTIASRGGDVALIARSVRNEGTIAAPKGTAALVAGYEVLAKEKADADGRFVVRIGGADTEAVNAGTLAAANAEMRANGGNLYALAGNTGGVVKATGAATRDGRVFLTAGDGGAVTVDSPVVAQRRTAEANPKPDRPKPERPTLEVREPGRRDGAAKRPPRPSRRPDVSGGDIRVSGESVRVAGTLDASGTTGRGGTLVATGGTVVLSGTAALDVSGTAGGTLLVGGDYQGGRNAATRYLAEPVATARTVTVEAGAQLRADGTRGDGGRVVLWSDRDTAFAGAISARGAAKGGDAEVSGKARLAFTGTADLRGTAGFGTLLLDPYNLTISDAADSGMSGFSASGDDSVLNVNTLKSALNFANVLVTTGEGGTQAGDITVAAPLTWNASTTLTLSAYRDITVNAALTAQGSEGMIVLMAGRDVAVNAAVTGENRSDVSLLAKRDVAVNTAVSGAKVVLWSDYGGIGTGTVRFGAGATVTASGGASILYNPTAYTAPTDYSGIAGAGTVVTGYMLVNTAENLQAIGTNLAGTYALGRDIDAQATAGWNSGAGFAPLGSAATPFTGRFDGRDHAIDGLTINRPGSDDVGLFGVVGTSGAVRDVRMVGGSVLGANRVGALAGSNAGTVTWASATGTVTGRGGEVGGLVGSNAGTVGQSFATGAVTAQGGAVGGLAGSNSGTILQAYASGAVTAGGDQVGGLVGRMTAGSVTEAYALGSVTGTRSVGGLIGDNGGTVTESYATGAVTGQDAGGLIGANGGTVEWSFWDTQTTGLGNNGIGTGSGTANGIRGLTSDEIRTSDSVVQDGQYFAVGTSKWYLNFYYPDPDFRPIGMWEAPRKGADGYAVVSNLHQLVLINAATDWFQYYSGNYRLGMDIDASETAGLNPAGIWGTRGFVPIGVGDVTFRGTFDGNGHVINNLFINRPQISNLGFFGRASGSASRSAIIKNIGIVNGQFSGASSIFVGGLVGSTAGGVIVENSYFIGTVSGHSVVGGLVGAASSTDRIKRSYAAASVTAAGSSAGGLVGRSSAEINESYASGRVTGASNVGGFIGQHTQGTITNSYWDTQTSGQQNGVGNKVVTGLTGLTTAEARQASSYVGWDFAKDWYQSADMRPIGRWEAATPGSDGVATVTNLHQLQLIDANPAGSYRLGADIDAQATSGADAAGVWGAGGFTPLGTGGAGFTGRFDGRGHLIRGLTINRPTSDDVGLFGGIGSGGTVGYVGLDATSTVTGRDRVGAIAGLNGGTILQSFSWAGVSGQGLGTGGLVGLNTATIRQSYATGAVTGQGDGVGGLVGDNNVGGSIAQSYATGAVTGQGLGTGGLVGNNGAGSSITQSYATGAVSGQGAALGGLVGRNDGTTTLSYWNTQTSGMATGAGAGSVTGVTGLDSAGMRDASSFTGFDRMVWAPADGTDAPLLYGVSGVVGVVQSAVYGDDPQTVPVSLLGGWAWSRVTGSASSTLAAGTNVGTYLNFLDTSGVSATFSAGGAARVVNVGAVVTPATLTVTAANGTMVYGNAVPSLGYTTSGWKNGQSGALLSGVAVSTSATALSDVGDYASTATGGVLSGAAVGNYTIVHTTGTVSITPATLTVTADNGTMVYGDAMPSLGYTTSGWKNGQSGALLSGVGVSTNATALSDVGSAYTTTATGGTLSGAAAGNYTLSHVGGSFSVTPATLTVTAADGTMVYGDAVPSLSYATSGWKNGQSGALLSGVTVSTDATSLSNVGTAYTTTATGGTLSGAAAGNYTLSHVGGSFSITPATLTVTADNGTMVYGDAVPSLGYSVSGWKNGQSGALLSGVGVSTNATSLSNVGTAYTTTATGGTLSGAAAGNYTLSHVNGSFSVTPATLTVTAADGTMVYGDTVPSLGYTTSGWKNGQSGALLSGVGVSTNATALSDVGSAYVTTATGGTLSGAAAGNYTLSHVNGSFSVTPATLTVTAANGTMVYGDAVPSLGYTTSGWKNGQSGALLSSVGVSTNATTLSDVGSAYTTTATGGTLSGAAAGNYTISHVGGSFSVTPATLTVTAGNGMMVYGDAVPSLGYTTSGWRNGQGGALLSGVGVSINATALSNVGNYTSTATGGTLSGAAAGNYTLSYVDGAFSVTPATLTVTAANGTMVYGDAVPSLGYTTSGWRNGQSDALLSAVAASTNATTLSNVGIYTSTATGGTLLGAAAGNYTLSHATGTVTITPAPLTVTAADGTMVYGDAVPSLGYSVSGWKNGQGDASLPGISVSASATSVSNVGAYTTMATGGTLSGGAAGNYTLSYVNGSFAVTPATLTVTAANGTMIYGDTVPSLGYTISGWKNGQSDALLSGVTVSSDATSLSDVGTAYITTATGGTLAGAATGNYTISHVGGSFSVTPAALTVTAGNGMMVYGDAVPSLGYTSSGWKNGQSGALLSAVAVSTNATTLSDVGSAYVTTATGGTLSGSAAGNYTLSHVGGTFSVTPATLTVTAANGTLVYGDAVPSLGYSVAGWRNGQSDALLSGVIVSADATSLSNVGVYASTAAGGTLSGAATGNYVLRHVDGSFSVTPATLTVTAANGAMVYGDTAPSVGYSVAGWKNGQGEALLSGVTVSTDATSLSNVGLYTSSTTGGILSGAAAGNYTLSRATGTVTITPATLTVTAANGAMVYGDAAPTLGYGVSGWRNGQSDALLSGVTVSTNASSLSDVGTFYLTTATGGALSGAAVGNYTLSYVGGSLSVTPAILTVTAANGAMVYGDAVPSLGYTSSGWKNGQGDALLSGVGVSTDATTLSDVGAAYTTTAMGGTLAGAAAGNYTLAYVGGAFSVTPAALTVTAASGTMVYGDAVPSLGYAISGWKNGQGDALLSGVGVSTDATSLSNVGNYASTATGGTLSGAAAGNYTLNHVNGAFSVIPATLTVTAANGTMVYGDAVPSLGYTTSGWRNGQGGALLSAVTVSTDAASLSNVGAAYTTTAMGGTLSGPAAGNYTLSYVDGAFSVTPATLTVTAANGTMVYGDAVPSLGYTTSGWRNGQSDALLPGVGISTDATSLSNVGTSYLTMATGGVLSGGATGNYTLAYVGGAFSVTPATLTVTAADATMIYGENVPALGYTTSGWKNGQGDASLSGISVSTGATSLSNVGTYASTATGGMLSGAAAGNYTLSHVGGTVLISPAPLTVTAGNGARVYGDAVPSLGYSVSGWKNSQGDALLSGVTVSTNATALSDVGSAYLTSATDGTLSGAAAGNYTLSYVNGAFSVTPAVLTVTAANGTMAYGDAVPSLGYSVSGWRNGQNGALLSGVGVSTNATSLSNVGTAYITTATGGVLSGAAAGNYTLTHLGGTFAVTPATLTVTAADGTMVYGDAVPALGYTTSGWKNGQGDALISGIGVSTAVTSLSNAGAYVSTVTGGVLSGAAVGNYSLSHITGTVTVTPAPLTVTAGNGMMVYGDAVPSLGYGVSGWRNGQSDALLSGVIVSTNATALSNVGAYASAATGGTLSGAAAGNYTIRYVNGAFAVTPAPLTVTAANGTMVLGDSVPSLGYSVSGWKNGQGDALLSGVGVSTSATSLSSVGRYVSTATGGVLSGDAAGNYTLRYVDGNLVIVQPPPVVVVDDPSRPAGTDNPPSTDRPTASDPRATPGVPVELPPPSGIAAFLPARFIDPVAPSPAAPPVAGRSGSEAGSPGLASEQDGGGDGTQDACGAAGGEGCASLPHPANRVLGTFLSVKSP